MKICTKCGEEKALDQYGKRGNGLFAYCKVCRARIRKSWSNGRVGKEAVRKAHLKSRYGITVEDYDRMLSFQEGACGICQTKTEPLHIDHCHKAGTFRGLLCGPCNRGLGLFKDNPQALRAAADYLEF